MKKKFLEFNNCELKFDQKNDGQMIFAGYASVFGGVDSYGDTIDPKAYDKTLKNRERPIRMRWNHYGPVIGKWTKLEADGTGLYVEGELTPGHSKALDVYASLKHGAVDGMSIGYRVNQFEKLSEERTLLKEIELIEISIVEEPADTSALVSDVKSSLEKIESLKDVESLLRDAVGFTKSEATALVSKIKNVALRESDRVNDELGKIFNNFLKR